MGTIPGRVPLTCTGAVQVPHKAKQPSKLHTHCYTFSFLQDAAVSCLRSPHTNPKPSLSCHRTPCRACRRGLQSYLNQRRKLLSYLRRDNFPRYAFVLHKLGLKDTYAKQVGSC